VAFVNPTFLTNDCLALLDELVKGKNDISRKNIKKAITNLLEQSICVIVILLDHELLDFIVSEFNLYPPFFLVYRLEYLYIVVFPIRNVNLSIGIYGEMLWIYKLAITRSQ
jgi:hypothetical protein